MPEWLRLFKQAGKNGASTIRSLAPTLNKNVSSFRPAIQPALENTYFLPVANLSGATKKMYNAPLSNVLNSPSDEMIAPMTDTARRTYRSSLGIPEDFDSFSTMSLDEATNILRHRVSPYDANHRINFGLSALDPRGLNYNRILNAAEDVLYSHRQENPYNSVQEFLDEASLFGGRFRPPREFGIDATVRGLVEGADMRNPAFSPYLDEATRMAYNLRLITDPNNPYVQRALANDTSWGLSRYDPFDSIGSVVVGPDDVYREAGDASGMALNKLGRFGARYLTTQEKAKLLEGALPDGITLSDLSQEQIRAFKNMFHPTTYVGNMVSKRYSRDLLDKMANLESLPEPERTELTKAISSAYREPTEVNGGRYGEELFKIYADRLRSQGINVSPEELKVAFNIHDPKYPEISAKIRAKGLETLPGDITHMTWFQLADAQAANKDWRPSLSSSAFDNWTLQQKEQFEQRAKKIIEPILNSQAQIRTGIQARALERAMPRGTGVFETNTSPDSYKLNIKTAITSPLYGAGPGKITLFPLKDNGNSERRMGNDLQLSRLVFDDTGKIKSTIGLPEVEKNAFTISELEDIINLLDGKRANPDALKLEFSNNPEYKERLSKILNVVNAVKNKETSAIAKTFEIANKKNRSLGMQEITPLTPKALLYPDNPGFYDSKELDELYWLLRNLSSDAQFRGRGWAPRIERIPVGSLKQKQGGKLPE